jgi:cytochrome c oxidase subunit 2
LGQLGLVGAMAGLLLSGCAHHAPQDTLRPAGPESRYIDHLFYPVFWIAVGVFCLVAGLAVYCIIRFRARGDDDRPRQIHGSPRLEIGWTIVPALLLIGVGLASVAGIFHLARTPKGAPITLAAASASSPATIQGDVLHVNVLAHRWWFEFRYPGLGANGADLVTAGELHIPTGKDVYLDVTSDEPLNPPTREGRGGGVIHNFWIPRLAGKIYAVPGRHSHLILNADSPGIYPGQCTEFCGISHANMRMRAVAQTAGDFAAWVVDQRRPQQPFTAADQFTSPDAYQGYQLFNGLGTCAGCHTVTGTPAAAQVGPNLTHLQLRGGFAGFILPLNDANLRLWLRNPQSVKPGANMVIPKLNEDQITQLIAYLDTLK